MLRDHQEAERVTRYQIRELRLERDNVTFGAFDGSILVAKTSGRVEWMALKSLAITFTCCTVELACNGTIGAAHAARRVGHYRFIIASFVRTAGLTKSTIWNRSAGIATETSTSVSVLCKARKG